MKKDIFELLNHCISLHIPQTTKKINKKFECSPVSVSQLFKQLNLHRNGHLLEQHFNASGRFFM